MPIIALLLFKETSAKSSLLFKELYIECTNVSVKQNISPSRCSNLGAFSSDVSLTGCHESTVWTRNQPQPYYSMYFSYVRWWCCCTQFHNLSASSRLLIANIITFLPSKNAPRWIYRSFTALSTSSMLTSMGEIRQNFPPSYLFC